MSSPPVLDTSAPHIPVLLDEVLAALSPEPGETMVDGTFGAGGYTLALLKSGARVIAFDRDPDAIAAGRGIEDAQDGLTLIGRASCRERVYTSV